MGLMALLDCISKNSGKNIPKPQIDSHWTFWTLSKKSYLLHPLGNVDQTFYHSLRPVLLFLFCCNFDIAFFDDYLGILVANLDVFYRHRHF